MKRVFGTIYRAESIVDDWMGRIVAALPREPEYESMRAALMTQEHDERMHRGSLLRVATEVLGIDAADADRVARKYNNFVAEILFDQFEVQMQRLLRPNRPIEDVYTAIFIYGVLSEDVVANSDVVIRRAKGNALYDIYDLPGMKEGQTNVRRDEGRHVRIAVLATHRFLEEFEGAAERLLAISTYYMELADRMVRRAKASRGLIDAHLAESYGPDVDSLYYYVMNMKRLAVRLDELGLREGVLEVKRRVDAAIAELSGEDGEPIVETPNRLVRLVGPKMLRLARRRLPAIALARARSTRRAAGRSSGHAYSLIARSRAARPRSIRAGSSASSASIVSASAAASSGGTRAPVSWVTTSR